MKKNLIETSLKNFPKQFSFKPEIQNQKNLASFENVLVVGMGGSALSADILKCGRPDLNLTAHKSYDLPSPTYHLKPKTLIVASSYSGNTEETVSSFEKARKLKANLAAITTGGKLLALAKKYKTPHIKLPDTNIQPRVSLGFSLISLLKIIGQAEELKVLSTLAKKLNPSLAEKTGRGLAERLWDKVPVIYASASNLAVAYNWKIKLNETGKIPSFCNVFPELNHNEMTSFDVIKTTKVLSQKFHFLFLKDKSDPAKIQKRMLITEKLYKTRELFTESIEIKGENVWHKIFQNLLVADWTAVNLSRYYGTEATEVPMVEEFKKLIRQN
ncbi:MAG: SIS domain-containing protein [Patescibacteria group bacterium]